MQEKRARGSKSEPEVESMSCPGCKTEMADGSKYCSECGSDMKGKKGKGKVMDKKKGADESFGSSILARINEQLEERKKSKAKKDEEDPDDEEKEGVKKDEYDPDQYDESNPPSNYILTQASAGLQSELAKSFVRHRMTTAGDE